MRNIHTLKAVTPRRIFHAGFFSSDPPLKPMRMGKAALPQHPPIRPASRFGAADNAGIECEIFCPPPAAHSSASRYQNEFRHHGRCENSPAGSARWPWLGFTYYPWNGQPGLSAGRLPPAPKNQLHRGARHPLVGELHIGLRMRPGLPPPRHTAHIILLLSIIVPLPWMVPLPSRSGERKPAPLNTQHQVQAFLF